MGLDANNPIPLHIQLKEILLQEIRQGLYQEKIPSERELMEKYTVSRTTVREAVSAMVQEGMLKKVHGKGTFVNRLRSINDCLGQLSSFTETIEGMGMKAGAKLLYQATGSKKEIADILGVESYCYIKRLRFADEEPIAIERHYYPCEIAEKLQKYDLNKIALYGKLESEGVLLHEAEQRISAKNAEPKDAKLLGISEGACILVNQRFITDSQGKPIEYYYGVYRADKYVFSLNVSRNLKKFNNRK